MISSENLEILALQNMINGSEAMFERRRRVLKVARNIIAKQGADRLNMRDLSEQADVSTKTIYNAFGSKETVVALAIYTNFQKFAANLEFESDAASFDGALSRQATSTMRDVDVPFFMKAVVSLYFSSTIHPSIRAVLLDLATRSWSEWLRIVEDRRELRPGVVLRELLDDLSNVQYACIHEWCSGSLTDEVFLRRALAGVLTLLLGVMTGEAHTQVESAFTRLQGDAAFRETLFTDARARVDEAMDRAAAMKRRRPVDNSRAVL